MPLVVKAICSSPQIADNRSTNWLKFGRIKGSPPVNRTLRTPARTSTRTIRTIESNPSKRSWGKKPKTFSGMQ